MDVPETGLLHPRWSSIPGLVHGFLAGRVEPRMPVLLPRQVHGTRVALADPTWTGEEADGLVTASSGTVVGVVTADCVPILLVAERQRVAAAVHAGWRGAAAGIVAAALAQMRRAFGVEPSDVEASLGPAIGPCCYEVGDEVREAFERRSGSVTRPSWSGRTGRIVLDLRGAIRLLLDAEGVRRTDLIGPCTRCAPEFCSYRRDGATAGRQLSFIGWA
jgi:hypothetical protein